MSFAQHFHAPVPNVYSVEGTLILSADSKAADLSRVLTELREQIPTLRGVMAPIRRQIEERLEAALAEVATAQPNGVTILTHLEGAAEVLRNTSGAAERAGRFAHTLTEAGRWASVLFP